MVLSYGDTQLMEAQWGLTAYSSCPLGSCDAAPCRSPQRHDLFSHAQPCPLSSGPHPTALTPGGSTWEDGQEREISVITQTNESV